MRLITEFFAHFFPLYAASCFSRLEGFLQGGNFSSPLSGDTEKEREERRERREEKERGEEREERDARSSINIMIQDFATKCAPETATNSESTLRTLPNLANFTAKF